MRTNRTHQPLTYDVRLPDEAQADALRLLDASKMVVNKALIILWPFLDDFGSERTGPAWKQVGKCIGSPLPHGDRQWRCESEVVGRLLRGQAERKKAFAVVAPILSDGFIRPQTDKRPAGKNRQAIKEAITTLQKSLEEDDTRFVTLQNVVEQCCNYFFQHDQFPQSYEELQPIPVLSVGMLSYAGDDGREKGQAYRLALDLDAGVARFRFRYPDEAGVWRWRKTDTIIALPECLKERLWEGELMAPTLREERRAEGERFAVLDFIVEVEKTELPTWEQVERILGADWGIHTLLTATAVNEHNEQVGKPLFLNTGNFDGRQARTRRQIDELKKKVALYEQQRDALPEEDSKCLWYAKRLALYRREIERCWRKYNWRNRALAHLASNVLLLLCQIHDCSLLSMESLKTLKSTGRGKGVRGRWRNYRTNATIRGEIWRLLRYKCHLVGLRFLTCQPRGTSHTCPRCGVPANTYRSPSDRQEGVKWGRWMYCTNCSYNGDRDYCASVNIARLGVAYLVQMKQAGKARACSISDPRVKPVAYTTTGSALLLPPTGETPARFLRGKIYYYPGWFASVFLQSSQPRAVFLRLCG
ncbi:zinc ribbon domain-containing protein [Ktedonosporobacter rubrisoli]|nr:zinc ribbon domain-containing protein [Ktedonosporobacter rubrisoli]